MLLDFAGHEQMEKIMLIHKEISLPYNTPKNGVYMGFSFKN
jgi:hypothetical protein